MPKVIDVDTTGSTAELARNYVPAVTVSVQTPVNTLSLSDDVRVVVTKKNHGTVNLRYAPIEPKLQVPDTT